MVSRSWAVGCARGLGAVLGQRAWWSGLFALAILLATVARGQSPVLQRGYDKNVAGATLAETTLKVSNIGTSTFGLLFNLPVDDVIFAQPLYMPNVTINQAKHNVLYVATMSDTLYAFDADSGGSPLWTVNLASIVGATAVPIGQFVFSGDKGTIGNLGVLSTPVIDASTNTIYVVACTLENGTMVYRLHAIDITTGGSRVGSGVQLAASYKGVVFNAPFLLQRTGLTLSGNQVVIGFAAMQLEFSGGYEGWVLSYDKSSFAQTGAFATATTGTLGSGIWQSGRPPAVDSAGFVYVFTGNSYGGGYDGVNNFAESVLKLDPSQGLKLVDWFTAGDWSSLDADDLDLASSGPMLIPGTGLLSGGGKEGALYVLNTSNMGKFKADDSQIVQKVMLGSEIRGGPVYWPRSSANGGPLMFNWGIGDAVKSYAFTGTGFAATPSSQGSQTGLPYPGGILTLSANADTPGTGVLWATTADNGNAEDNPPAPATLHAFNASNLSQELWNSKMNATRDDFGQFAKFVPPVVANGRVYQSTWSRKVAVYGLLAGGGGTADFQISASPGSQNVAAGQSVSITVNVTALNGFAGAVSLSLSGAPSGVTGNFVPAIVTGTGQATLQVSASATAPVGSYTLVVSGTSAALTHSANVSLTIVAGAVPTVDAQAFANKPTASNTVSVSGVTTTAPNELLLAFVAADYLSGANTTVTGVTGGGLAWSLVQRTNTQAGTSEIWSAYAPAAASNMSVSATLSQSVVASMYVTSFKGVDTTGGAIGAKASTHSAKGAPTGSLVTTRPNSLVLAVGNDYDNAIARTPGTGQSLLLQYLTPLGDTYWVQQINAPVAVSGMTATINDTAPTTDQYNLSLVEVRAPPAITYSISGTLAPAALAANSSVVLSGCASATVAADTSGNFTFTEVPNGTCVVTPSHAGVAFTPASRSVIVSCSA